MSGLLTACGGMPPEHRTAGSRSPDAAWRSGPRDSALAVTLACALLREFPGDARAGSCQLEEYKETLADYTLRLRETYDAVSDRVTYARSEVRLSKDGQSATVVRLPEP